MKLNVVVFLVLTWTLLSFGAAHGQYPPEMTKVQSPNQVPGSAKEVYLQSPKQYLIQPESASEEIVVPSTSRPSDWVLYRQADSCNCPMGGNTPYYSEYYVRTGVSVPYGNSVYNEVLDPGLAIQGGMRLMLFNEPHNRSWFLDLGLGNIWNHAQRPDVRVPLSIIVPSPAGTPTRVNLGQGNLPGVTIRTLNRTYVNMGLGHMWYLWEPADSPNYKVRFGLDGGGRYGAARGQFNEIRKRTDTFQSAYFGMMSDFEFGLGGCCTFNAGVRAEYSYTWLNILQGNDADVQEINVLLSLGLRY